MKALATIVLFLGLLWPGGAAAARLALVIGINDYDNITPLSKAVGDAEAMAETLSGLGFEVTKVLNPDRRTLNQAVTAFRRALKPGDAALVHFSGHGVEVKGHNLLLPSDIPATPAGEEDYLIEEAIDLGGLIDRVSDSGAAVRIFIIDACRNNPIESLGERGLNRLDGLAPLDPPKGSFVLYSAASRQAALDELGPDDTSPTSVYTRVLLSKLKQPGLTLSQIAREVRVEVAALAVTVGRVQSPAYYDELNEEFILSPIEPQSEVAPERPTTDDAEAFALAKSFNSVAAWEAFLKTYKTGFYADMARVALDQLIQEQVPPASAEFALAVEFEGDVPQSFPVLTFTERANTTDCTGKPCGRSSVKRQIVSLTGAEGPTLMVPMPETATRVCVIIDDDSATIASANLVTPSEGTFSSAKGGDLEANGKSACSFWMTDAKTASKWVLTLKKPNLPAANTENFAFAIEAEAGLDLVIRGYGGGDVPFFEQRVDTREIYRSEPHYVVRVDEDVMFSNRLLRVCVEDLTGKWSLIPAGGKGEVCDDRPVDTRGTYAFVGRTFPSAPAKEPVPPVAALDPGCAWSGTGWAGWLQYGASDAVSILHPGAPPRFVRITPCGNVLEVQYDLPVAYTVHLTLQSEIPADIRPIAAAIVDELAKKPVLSGPTEAELGRKFGAEISAMVAMGLDAARYYSAGDIAIVLFELGAGKSFGFSFWKEHEDGKEPNEYLQTSIDNQPLSNVKEQAAPLVKPGSKISTTVSEGLVANLSFPLAGNITAWKLYFAYETECENDHYASITSPTGRTIIVMDRGLRRCSGTLTRFSSENDNEGGNFVGSEALGQWQFGMKDLDNNEHSGVLHSVWMKITVNNNGVVTDHTVSLDGLPRDIPNPT